MGGSGTGSASSFCLESGAAVPGTAFVTVEVVPAPERRIFITDADALAAYVASTADHYAQMLPPGRTWPQVVETVRTRAADTIAAEDALTVTANLGALFCR